VTATKHLREISRIALDLYPTAKVGRTRGSHVYVQLSGPKGETKVILASTPGDHRWIKNFRMTLRRCARQVGLLPE